LTALEQQRKTLWFFGGAILCLLLLLALLARAVIAWIKARREAQEAEELRAVNLRLTEEVRNRKKAEHELLAAQDALLHAGRMAALGQVAASVVHELSQPITSMSMFASSCRRLAQKEGHTDLAETAGHMLSMVQRVKSLIEQLRQFSRKAPDKTAPVSLRKVLENALTVLQCKQEDAGCRPSILCPPDMVIMADALQLEQVCINLIHNALDALIATPKDEKRVDITVERLPNAVLLSVTDSGPGIDPAIRDKIFTPFFTTKKSGEGIGLGLAIVDNIVRSMHGVIEARNMPPRGARFTLRLPPASVPDNPHE
jgi:two-component system C4-dicarboxylate transport sensor histidine kinase DctB